MFGKSSMSAEEHQSSWMVFRPAWRGRGTTSNTRAKLTGLKRISVFTLVHLQLNKRSSPCHVAGCFGAGSNRDQHRSKSSEGNRSDMSRWLEEPEGSSSEATSRRRSRESGKWQITAGSSILHRAPPADMFAVCERGRSSCTAGAGRMKRTTDDSKHLSSDRHCGSPVVQHWQDHVQLNRWMRAEA